jgi:hypothetical protein
MRLGPARAIRESLVATLLWWAGTVWIALALTLMLIECGLVWWVVSFEAFVYTISPLNFRNWIVAILVLLPGWLLIKLAVTAANHRKRGRASLPESNS